jgi:hypothetical protein
MVAHVAAVVARLCVESRRAALDGLLVVSFES